MKIKLTENTVIVDREENDPKYYGIVNAAGESALLLAIKRQLNKQGYDLIKKRMWKDGHLMDDMQQYIRTRKPSGDPDKDIMIWNTFWQVAGIEKHFNEGQAVLGLMRDCFTED